MVADPTLLESVLRQRQYPNTSNLKYYISIRQRLPLIASK